MSFEYKTVGAPERGKRRKGARSHSDRAAVAFDEILQAEAVDGWEYLRTDILPVIERKTWFGGTREAHRAVMVFRRPLGGAQPTVSDQPAHGELRAEPRRPGRREGEVQLRAVPSMTEADPARGLRHEPDLSTDPDLALAESVRGPSRPRPDDQ